MFPGRKSPAANSRSARVSFPLRSLVVIDQEPLRSRAAEDCTEAIARLNRARAGWHHFERKDKPAFIRWRAREFGALLSRAREVEVQIRDLQTLVHEVEMEMRRGFQDVYGAYERVMARRANPYPQEAEGNGASSTANAD